MEQQSSPWLTITHDARSSSIHESKQAFDSLGLDPTSPASFISMIGRRSKSLTLRYLLKSPKHDALQGGHGQVYLWKDPTGRTSLAPVYVDTEVQGIQGMRATTTDAVGPVNVQKVDWLDRGVSIWTKRRIGSLLSSRVLNPMCDVTCYFACDLGGIRAVAALLAEQIMDPPTVDQSLAFLPKVLVVTETISKAFDPHEAKNKLCENILELLRTRDGYTNEIEMRNRLEHRFESIAVFGFCKSAAVAHEQSRLRKCILALASDAARAKSRCGMRFRPDQSYTVYSRLIKHFCVNGLTPFRLIHETRPAGFISKDLTFHLKDVFDLLPAETWLWHAICPLVASATIFNNYPPSSHMFPASQIYELVKPSYTTAVHESFLQPIVRNGFLNTVHDSMQTHYINLSVGHVADARSLHEIELRKLWPWLSKLFTFRTCLCCMMRAPEKVLSCGHALCDTCVQVFGTRSLDDKYAFSLTQCLLCGAEHQGQGFRIIPPTAGIRMLSIDGGGIRGIIPLVCLNKLELLLSRFRAPIAEYFDFVCGTSAGGLIILGLFMMRWSSEECRRKFEELATRTFHRKSQASILHRVQDLALAYLRDCQYNSLAIEEAFKTAFGQDIGMFNPLTNATRVAVTTTTAKNTDTCFFANYNGGRRPDDAGYSLVRAKRPEHDPKLSEAASSTSAAPWFFKPKWIQHVGTFQDGALQHNNPLRLALWETKFLWPTKPIPDFALSIGTGCIEGNIALSDPKTHSPVQDRFMSRLFRTFMRSMDGEQDWRQLRNGLPEAYQSRFHRVNLRLEGTKEPELDDIKAMNMLRNQATKQIKTEYHLRPVLDAIYASAFYFEFDGLPLWRADGYECRGHIMCRLKLSTEGRRMLYQHLIETQSYFLVSGTPVPCIERKTKSLPLFKCPVKFHLSSLQDHIRISIRGVTTESMSISGLPKTAMELIEIQGIHAPFGRADHRREKPLPTVPSKRKYCSSEN